MSESSEQVLIPLRTLERGLDEIREFTKTPKLADLEDEFLSKCYPVLKAGVDNGYDLKTLCDRLRRFDGEFAKIDLEKRYAEAKAAEATKRRRTKRIAGSNDAPNKASATNVEQSTPTKRQGKVVRLLADDGLFGENDPNDPANLRAV
jgi:hypothetical protein